MPLPLAFHARCYDPTRRWPGRLRAALDAALWRVVTVDSCAELLPIVSGSTETLPAESVSCSFNPSSISPALHLCVLEDSSATNVARWWSLNRSYVHPKSTLIVVASHTTDVGLLAFWQELGAAAVITTTLELPLVVQLAERFAANPENRAPDVEHPLTPFWQALPWSDALPKVSLAR